MADAPTAAQVLANIVPVLVGGLLAVGGGAATQWYLDRSRRDEERRKQKAVKYEELIGAIYEYDHWLDTMRNIRVFDAKLEVTSSPFARIYAISSVYFPEFVEQIGELSIVGQKYELWMIERAKDRLGGKLDKLSEGMAEAYNPYSMARIKLVRELGEAARKEFSKEKKEGGL